MRNTQPAYIPGIITCQNTWPERKQTPDKCHCGSPMRGSDHCPECGCEEYEAYCEHEYQPTWAQQIRDAGEADQRANPELWERGF